LPQDHQEKNEFHRKNTGRVETLLRGLGGLGRSDCIEKPSSPKEGKPRSFLWDKVKLGERGKGARFCARDRNLHKVFPTLGQQSNPILEKGKGRLT